MLAATGVLYPVVPTTPALAETKPVVRQVDHVHTGPQVVEQAPDLDEQRSVTEIKR
jgi:hypothetical protein